MGNIGKRLEALERQGSPSPEVATLVARLHGGETLHDLTDDELHLLAASGRRSAIDVTALSDDELAQMIESKMALRATRARPSSTY